jgi:hypothetical protein
MQKLKQLKPYSIQAYCKNALPSGISSHIYYIAVIVADYQDD